MPKTVKELINELLNYPPDMLVFIDGYEWGLTEIWAIGIKKIILNYHNEETYGGVHEKLESPHGDISGKVIIDGIVIER